MKSIRNTLAVTMLLVGGAACAAGGATGQQSDNVSEEAESGSASGSGQACVPGHQTACACPGGGEGVQACTADGSGLGECVCSPFTSGGGGDDGQPSCGDNTCGDDENCHTCPSDCGECEPCTEAPSCDNAMIPPASLPHSSDFDIKDMSAVTQADLLQRLEQAVAQAGPGMRVLAAALDETPTSFEHPLVTALREVFYKHPSQAQRLRSSLAKAGMLSAADFHAKFPAKKLKFPTYRQLDAEIPGGTIECGAPLLRVGIQKVTVIEEDDDIANDIVYCLVQAEAATGGEVRITPKTPNLDEGKSHTFPLESGVFWGQKELRTPGGNLLITYDCIEADTTQGYQDLIGAIGNASSQVGNVVEGDNGWIFTTVGAITPVITSGLALDSDDHLFNAQQTIALDKQLALTNGAHWKVRKSGKHGLSKWDWELTVRAWGCAEYGEKE